MNITTILQTYIPDDSLFSEEEPMMNKLKHIIYSLPEPDKRIILMYAELRSLRKLAAELGVCASTAHAKIRDIREKILCQLN